MSIMENPLAEYEIRTLKLLAQGLNNREIGEILGISQRTSQHYIFRITQKLGIHSRVLLAFYAFSKGYVTNADIKEAIQRERAL